MSSETPHAAEGLDAYEVALKDERSAVIRGATIADAAQQLTVERETHTLGKGTMQLLEELSQSVEEQERAIDRFIAGQWAGLEGASIVAEVDGELAGEVNLKRFPLARLRHNARLGLGVSPKFQALGIGRALMEAAIRWARMTQEHEDPGVTRIDLSHIGGNDRAHALYESLGFRQVGVHTNKVRDPDGTLRTDVDMELLLD